MTPVCVLELEVGLASHEGVRHVLQTRRACVEAAARGAAKRLHQCENRGNGGERSPALHVAVHESRVSFGGAGEECGDRIRGTRRARCCRRSHLRERRASSGGRLGL